ncbi:MAG: hypothetical protein V3V08_20715 [Nannocystaceae bacterium]
MEQHRRLLFRKVTILLVVDLDHWRNGHRRLKSLLLALPRHFRRRSTHRLRAGPEVFGILATQRDEFIHGPYCSLQHRTGSINLWDPHIH